VLVSSVGDEKKIDRWETYDPATPGAGPDSAKSLVAVEEDTDGDGRADRWENTPPAGCRRLLSMRTATVGSIVGSRIRKEGSC
jgi:hypothetical protein